MRIMYLADRTPDEIERVAHWLVGQYETAADRPGAIARFRQRVERGSGPTVFVAVDEGIVVGSASLAETDMPSMPQYSPWLASVYISPESQGRGVCAALIRRVEAEALVLGFPWLYFRAQGNEEAFEKLGWFCVDWNVEQGRPSLVMARDLRQAAEQAA